MIIATEATGTTTATAIVPPGESPEPPLPLPPVADAVVDAPVAVADILLAEFPVDRVGNEVSVDVIITVCGPVVPSVADVVIIDVMTEDASVVLLVVEVSGLVEVLLVLVVVGGCAEVIVEDVDEVDDVEEDVEEEEEEVVAVAAVGSDVVDVSVGVAVGFSAVGVVTSAVVAAGADGAAIRDSAYCSIVTLS
ncbi:hypothetical protein ETB97_002260 [Aspergillus alliaceus]|uniref:Uncharacterized protein n=1 Tax=Petromyces alliaceus TaxID=209559 RepID=A0A8H6AC63_PETAA|nr:hypothetical protein ETB97_002260 [Aspergillus burnettii]